MNFNKEKDNIISIVKSIRPINYLYSKQNKDYDKFFRSSSVKGLIKQINTKQTFNEFLIPGESMEDLDNKKNTFMDVNFKSTFNYIEQLSNLKNLPMTLVSKSYYKKGKNKNNYENRTNSKFNKKKLLDAKKKKKLEKISQIKNCGDEESINTLDPGRYHPNYDFIKRRYPCAYLGKPKIKEDSFLKEGKEIVENEEIKENESENTNSHNENEDENENDTSNQNINTNKNNLEDTSENKSNQFNRNAKYKKSKKMNFSSPNFFYNQKGKASSKNIMHKYVLKQTYKSKDHNNATSCSNILDLDKSQKIKEQLKLFKIKDKNNYKRNKKKSDKNSSMENIRCPIIFDRMPGRDRSLNFIDGDKDACRSNYNPDYDIVRPHIPSTIFKSKRKFENYKKYITGRIIRSYCYSPDNYFVFEIKNNKNNRNNILGKYGAILSKA